MGINETAEIVYSKSIFVQDLEVNNSVFDFLPFRHGCLCLKNTFYDDSQAKQLECQPGAIKKRLLSRIGHFGAHDVSHRLSKSAILDERDGEPTIVCYVKLFIISMLYVFYKRVLKCEKLGTFIAYNQ